MLSDRTLSKLQGIRKCSINGHRVKDLLQMILNAPDLWEQAYGNIYANKGGMTPGVDGRTIDGYSDERAANLRELLRENRYVPTPVQRVYIPKPNGKLRPLGMPTTDDKLVQEVWRMVLDGLLTAFPKMDIRSAHELSMIKEALFLSERESVFPDPASPSHTARRRPPPAGGDTAPISRRC